MLLGLILLAIGVVGFGFAGYWDLRYTEFPDWLPYSIIVLALAVRGVFAFAENNLWLLSNSVMIGLVFLALGLVLYFSKQWGDGDAWLLGALGFLFPDTAGFAVRGVMPFPLTLLFNFLFISLIYLVVYSLALGLRKREVNKIYFEYIRDRYKMLTFFLAVFFAVSWGAAFYFYACFSSSFETLMPLIAFPFLLTFILIFTYYAKMVEENLFKKKVNVKDLKVGDVILKGRWRGLTQNEIGDLKRKNKYVWVKEGVRFAPVFLFVMLISLFYGDLMLILI